jgi:hypothetical protein
MSERDFVDYKIRAAHISEGQDGDPLRGIFQVLWRGLDLEATWIGFDDTIKDGFSTVRFFPILALKEWSRFVIIARTPNQHKRNE